MPSPCPLPPELSTAIPLLGYHLPEERIARYPAEERDGARMLHLVDEGPRDAWVRDLPGLLRPGDLLVVNDARVLPARIFARRATGSRVELLLLPDPGMPPGPVAALVRPARRLRKGEELAVDGGGAVRLLGRDPDGTVWVEPRPALAELLEMAGQVPLPPYLGRAPEPLDAERYQTIFARRAGAVAAPTAGLHLSHRLLVALGERGVELASLSLFVGAGTFRPLRVEQWREDRLHAEDFEVPEALVLAVERARARGGRVVAVGTTVVRALESAARAPGGFTAGPGRTALFIRPGFRFRVVDRLLTNFHVPGSSLLALVAAFAGEESIEAAYRHALAGPYRFASYGDAMLIDREPPREP